MQSKYHSEIFGNFGKMCRNIHMSLQKRYVTKSSENGLRSFARSSLKFSSSVL